MTDTKMRTLELPSGKRTGIRLDETTWQAIDYLSNIRGQKWAEWVREVLDDHPNPINMTAIIREAVTKELLWSTILEERAKAFAERIATGFTLTTTADDTNFKYALEQADIEAETDLISVAVKAGIDEFGRVAYYIQNKLAECPNLIISTPFTPEQWHKAMNPLNKEPA